MLMRCLEAGGLNPVYDRTSDTMNHSAPSDYVPNPNGFYQFNGEVNQGFDRMYVNRLIKFPISQLNNLPQGDYKVIILKRNPEEIRKSMSRWTPFNSWGTQEVVTYLYDEFMDGVKAKLLTIGAEVIEINYSDIVNSPTDAFNSIRDAGWNIDVNECAKLVDSSLYRHNLEKDKQYAKSRT